MTRVEDVRAERENLWCFDQNSLRPGDVVLERGHSKFSPIIMWADHGEYSHALLWMGGGDFLEAVGTGVRPVGWVRTLVRNPEEWIVLRHPEPTAGAAAACESRAMAHKKYDLWGALNSPYAFARLHPTRLFCSQLVAAAYEKAGFPLVTAKAAYQITPNTLLRDSTLQPVLPIPLMRLPEQYAAAATDLLDRDSAYKGTPMSAEMAISQKVFGSVQRLYPTFTPPPETGLASPPGNLYEAIALLQLIDEASARSIADRMRAELDRSGYFDLAIPYLESVANQRLIDNARLKIGSIRGDDLVRLATHLRAIAPGRLEALVRHTTNATAYDQMYQARGLPLFERLRHMHTWIVVHLELIMKNEAEILNRCEERLQNAAESGRADAGD